MISCYRGVLQCPRCGAEAPETRAPLGCEDCGRAAVGVNLVPAYALEPGGLPVDDAAPGLFRFRPLLPLAPADSPVSLGEGGTPLLPLSRLGGRLGLDALLLKDESRNPTWSYKDRLAAVAVTKAASCGASTLMVSSTGNHGAAVAAYAARAGLGCVVLTLASVPSTMRTLMQAYGASVFAYERSADRWTVMRAAVDAFGWTPISGIVDPPIGSNPFGVEGYKTIAYEIWGDLGEVPDVVIVPAAYADGLAGIGRGFTDLVDLGLAHRTPRLVAVDPFGAYAAGLASSEEHPRPVPTAPSMAFSVATPVATYQGVRAVRSTQGVATASPSEESIGRMQLELASTEGIYAEGAAVLSVLAAEELVRSGWVLPGQRVVLVSTSTGLKDPASTTAHLPPVPVLDPTLQALEGALARVRV